jgi:hypothetical protein
MDNCQCFFNVIFWQEKVLVDFSSDTRFFVGALLAASNKKWDFLQKVQKSDFAVALDCKITISIQNLKVQKLELQTLEIPELFS